MYPFSYSFLVGPVRSVPRASVGGDEFRTVGRLSPFALEMTGFSLLGPAFAVADTEPYGPVDEDETNERASEFVANFLYFALFPSAHLTSRFSKLKDVRWIPLDLRLRLGPRMVHPRLATHGHTVKRSLRP